MREWEACFCLGSQGWLPQHGPSGHHQPVRPRMWPCWDLDTSQGPSVWGGGTGLGAPPAQEAADSQPPPSAQQRAARPQPNGAHAAFTSTEAMQRRQGKAAILNSISRKVHSFMSDLFSEKKFAHGFDGKSRFKD